MKEKERFEVWGSLACLIADTESSSIMNVLGVFDCCDLLNEQYKRIKELEEKTKRLKQLQKHLVKAVLDKVYNELICRFAYFVDNQDSAKIDIDAEEFSNILVKIEKKYKGE